jgi:hypothetical protein
MSSKELEVCRAVRVGHDRSWPFASHYGHAAIGRSWGQSGHRLTQRHGEDRHHIVDENKRKMRWRLISSIKVSGDRLP